MERHSGREEMSGKQATNRILMQQEKSRMDRMFQLESENQRLREAYEVLKAECADYYADGGGLHVSGDGIDDAEFISLNSAHCAFDGLGNYKYGKRARAALKKAELIRSGGAGGVCSG